MKIDGPPHPPVEVANFWKVGNLHTPFSSLVVRAGGAHGHCSRLAKALSMSGPTGAGNLTNLQIVVYCNIWNAAENIEHFNVEIASSEPTSGAGMFLKKRERCVREGGCMELHSGVLNDLVAELASKAAQQGHITQDDLLEALPEIEDIFDLLDDLYKALAEEGVEIRDTAEWYLPLPGAGDNGLEDDDRLVLDLAQLSPDDTVGLYLMESCHHPLLSAKEEIQLAKRMEQGREAVKHLVAKKGRLSPEQCQHLETVRREGSNARRKLIECNYRLVISIAKKYEGRGLPLLDLIQEGNIGLMRAVDKFNHRLGYKFSTYATWWIRQAITRCIADQSRTIRVPVHMTERIGELNRTARRLVQDLGREPSVRELAQELETTPRKVQRMMRIAQHPLSLEMPVGEDEESSLGDFVEDQQCLAPTEAASHSLLREELDHVFTSLHPREVQILQLRYGLKDGRSLTLEQVGKKYGLTRERIRQIEVQALRKLRHPSRSRRLRDYL